MLIYLNFWPRNLFPSWISWAVDIRSRGPGFDSRQSFLKVWAKKFLQLKDFKSWFSWTLRCQILWFGYSCAWFPTFCGNPFWRGVGETSIWSSLTCIESKMTSILLLMTYTDLFRKWKSRLKQEQEGYVYLDSFIA